MAAVLALAALATGLARGVWTDSPPPSTPSRPLVYVSGLDDHLLPERDTVPLHSAPDGPVVAHVPVDTLAWVRGGRGEWIEVELAEGEPEEGWIADFYLRGELHVVDPDAPGCPVPTVHLPGETPHHHLDPSTRVEMTDLRHHGSVAWVEVRSLRTGATSWVERRTLTERPGPDIRGVDPATPCDEILPEPDVPHTH